jgi:histidinol-phosphatase
MELLSQSPWDHAPAVVLVEEAGGTFSDSFGGHRLDRGEGRFGNGLISR